MTPRERQTFPVAPSAPKKKDRHQKVSCFTPIRQPCFDDVDCCPSAPKKIHCHRGAVCLSLSGLTIRQPCFDDE